VGVVIAGLIVVVIALGVAAAVALRRRDGGDVHSVEHYRHTLDTLGGVRSRVGTDAGPVSSPPAAAGRAAVPPVGTTDAGSLGTDDAGEAPVSAGSATAIASGSSGEGRESVPVADWRTSAGNGSRGAGSRAGNGNDNGSALAFGDLSQSAEAGRYPPHRRDRAMSAMNRRPRRLAAPVLATAIVLAVLAAVIVVGARSQSNPRHGHAAATSAGQASHARGTGAPSTGHSGHSGAAAASGKSSHTTKPTVPTNFKPVSASATTATYAPPSPAYTLVFTTGTGDCWVQVTTGGKVVLSSTMLAGQQQTVPANGTTTVELGAPAAMSITLDQEPVVMPSTYQTPFTLTFTPST